MILGFGNNVVSSLASDITASQTSFSVIPGDGPLFASLLTSDFSNKSTALKNYAKITLTDSGETAFEVCHLTAVSGDTLTVIRGQEGTAAKGWALKDVVANFATRGSENAFPQIAHIQSGFYTSGTAGGTANALTLELPTTFFLNGSADWVLKTPIVVYPSLNNTGAATLQLTMGGRVLGTFPLYKGNNAALVANDILKDVALVCLLDNTKTYFTILNPGGIYSSFVPVNRKVNGHELSKDVDVLPGDIFKLATAIGNAADLNDYTAPGLYFQAANAQASTGKNYPEANAGSLEVYKHAGFTQIYRIYSNSRAYIRTLYSGTWSAWTKQYDAANKPTAADVAAIPLAGSTAVTGIVRSSAELQSTSANSFRIGYGGYGTFWRNDGANLYLMLTNKDDPWGGYNALRPFRVSINNGEVVISKLNLSDFTYFDARYYTKTQSDAGYMPKTGAYTKTESDARFQAKGSYIPTGTAYTKAESDARYQKINTASRAANGWYKDTNTGMIFQWGKNSSSAVGNATVTFPIAFPNACLNVQNSWIRGANNPGTKPWGFVSSFNNTSASVSGDTSGTYWFAIGY